MFRGVGVKGFGDVPTSVLDVFLSSLEWEDQVSGLELVGVWEAAQLLGVSRQALRARRLASGFPPGYRAGADCVPFPEPVAELRCGPVWERQQISDYQTALRSRRRTWWLR